MGAPGSYSAFGMYKMECVTPVHVGVGRVGGAVDLPVMRDEFGYPFIHASSLKGAIKSLLHKKNQPVVEHMGKVVKREEGEVTIPSEVVFLDAYLITMPVRSLYGIFAYATSPFLIQRLQERLKFLGVKSHQTPSEIRPFTVIGSINGFSENNKIIFVEEFEYDKDNFESIENETLSKFTKFGKPLFVLPDNDFKEILDRSLLRITRVKLKGEEKIVETGHLWSEEYVPQWTFFHSAILAKNDDVMGELKAGLAALEHVIILGGKETIGKGIVRLEEF